MTYYWAVTSSSVDTSNMTAYINSSINTGSGTSKLAIPATYVSLGTYTFYLTLTNFLGSSATSSGAAVMVSGTPIPSVSITPSSYSMYSSQSLALYAKASLPSCASGASYSYTWREATGKYTSTAVDPRYFRLAAYTLSPGTYYFRVNVTTSSNASNSQLATVTVERSALYVTIAGGDKVIASTRSLILDASSSYDPDASSLGSAGLNYTWSCLLDGSNYGSSCGLSSPISSIAKPTIGTLSASTYVFTVKGSAWKGSRTATSSVTVTVLSSNPPYVTTTLSVTNSSKVNPQAKLYIAGSIVDSRSSGSFNYSWTLQTGTLASGGSLSSSASTTTSGTVTVTSSSGITAPVSLVLPAGSLLSKTSYTIRLSGVSTEGTGYSEQSFTTDVAPSSGSLSVSPTSGDALTTTFTMTASSWVDDASDYPLVYGYYYRLGGDSSGNSEVPLLTGSYSTSYSALLPQVCCAFESLQ